MAHKFSQKSKRVIDAGSNICPSTITGQYKCKTFSRFFREVPYGFVLGDASWCRWSLAPNGDSKTQNALNVVEHLCVVEHF